MAGTRTKAKTRAKSATKPAAATKKKTPRTAAPTTPRAAGAERTELPMLARRAPLGDTARDAFRSQCDDARAEKLGLETKAVQVLAESRQWAVRIEDQLAKLGPAQKVRYSQERLSFFLECIAALADQLEADAGSGAARGGAVGSVALCEQRARLVRNDIVHALEEIADGNATLEAELSAAYGDVGETAGLLASLRAMNDLAMRWASSLDPQIHALVLSTGLVGSDIDAGRQAAEGLASAMGGKTTTQARLGKDSTAVNRLEGRVLFEMRKAMSAFNTAAAQGVGERLVPGPATRRVLSAARGTAKASPGDPAPSPGVSAPAR